jgi:hypothetical protein
MVTKLMTAPSSDTPELSETQKKTLVLHALFCPPLTYADAFPLLGSLNYSSRQDAVRRLEALGLVQSDNLTSNGWETLAKLLDPGVIEKATTVWRDYLKKLSEDRNREAAKWANLTQYIYEPYRQAEPAYIAIDAPSSVVAVCTDYLKNARLCICVGAWAGAISRCLAGTRPLHSPIFPAQALASLTSVRIALDSNPCHTAEWFEPAILDPIAAGWYIFATETAEPQILCYSSPD